MENRRSGRLAWLKWWWIRRQLVRLLPKRTCLDCGFLPCGNLEADGMDRERFYTDGHIGGLPGDPVLCQNSIHWQRYKRAVDAAWTVGPAATIEQSYPLDGSSAW